MRLQKSDVSQDAVGTSSTFGVPLKSVGYWLKPVEGIRIERTRARRIKGRKEIDRKMDF